MSDLTGLRDHCRAMATADHKPECAWPDAERVSAHNRQQAAVERLFEEPKGALGRVVTCPGCVTATDRALFARLADEIDEYLSPDDSAPDLFGGEVS